MIFNTISFYAIFIVFLIFFVIIKKMTKIGMMLYVSAFSLFFFYKANAELCFLLPITALFSWEMTRIMSKLNGGKRKMLMIAIVIADLIPLIYYKYANFGIEIFNEIVKQNFPLLKITLPIGISFYTFQAISHVIDVYKKKFTLDVSFLEYLFYLSFFPLLLAGPITRAETFFPQIRKNKFVNEKLLYVGLWLIIVGLLKKAVVADYIAQYNNWIFEDPTGYSGLENLMGVIGYTIQIYCDFSGYSDMSIGIAALMGIELKENFIFPYQSLNISEFWRRWHISLSTWFRDYLYIPMGGNRKGKFRTYFNNFITMLVAGLWHGSTPMFVIWGASHGFGLIIHKSMKLLFLDKINNNKFVIVICWFMTFVFVACAWVFFRAPNLEICENIFSQITTNFDIAYLPYFIKARPLWTAIIVFALLIHSIREHQFYTMQEWFVNSNWFVKTVLLIIVVQLAIEFSSNNVQPFIYSQF